MELWYLACLRQWWTDRGTQSAKPFRLPEKGPTLDELCAWIRKSRSAVYTSLRSLEHKGLVTRVGDASDNAQESRKFIPIDLVPYQAKPVKS